MDLDRFLSKAREAATDAAQYGEEKIIPAATAAFQKADAYAKQKVIPGVEAAINEAKGYTKDKMASDLHRVGVAAEDFRQEQLGPAVENGKEYLNDKIIPAVLHFLELMKKDLVVIWEKISAWAILNQGNLAWMGVGGLAIRIPRLFTIPVLLILGFGSFGVRLASIASRLQSRIGNVGAGSPFAYLQSAAAGGYGAVVVDTMVRIAGTGLISWTLWKMVAVAPQ